MEKLYRFDLSVPSNKIRFCANLIGIELESVLVDLSKGDHKTDEFLAMNPAGMVPVLDDDTEETLSARILEQEHRLYPRAVSAFFEGRLTIARSRVRSATESRS